MEGRDLQALQRNVDPGSHEWPIPKILEGSGQPLINPLNGFPLHADFLHALGEPKDDGFEICECSAVVSRRPSERHQEAPHLLF